MGRKRHSAEEIVNKLREADVLLSKGQTVGQAAAELRARVESYYPAGEAPAFRILGKVKRCSGPF